MNSPIARVAERLVLVLFVAIGALVALAPAGFYFHKPQLLYYLAAEGAIISGIHFFTRRFDTFVTRRPGVLEYFLGELSTISLWGFLGVLWLLIYGLFYWVARLLDLIFTWLGFPEKFNSASVAFYISSVLIFVFASGIAWLLAQKMTRRLYTVKGNSRSVFYRQALQRQTKIWIYLGLSVIALGAMGYALLKASQERGFGYYFFLQLIPYLGLAWLLNLGMRARTDADIVGAIGRLLNSADYQVLFPPRSTDPTLDSILSGLDMLAIKGSRAFCVKVKTKDASSAPVEWTAGSSLHAKASALQIPEITAQLGIPELANKEVLPLMVLAGREQANSLVEFSQKMNLPIVIIEQEDMDFILATDGNDELRMLALKYFENPGPLIANTAGEPECLVEEVSQ